jgi:hypothetical protein
VQRDWPYQVRSYRAKNERYIHYVEQCKEEQGIRREKAAPDDELGVAAEIQKRIG